jgi:hypothetical protein
MRTFIEDYNFDECYLGGAGQGNSSGEKKGKKGT